MPDTPAIRQANAVAELQTHRGAIKKSLMRICAYAHKCIGDEGGVDERRGGQIRQLRDGICEFAWDLDQCSPRVSTTSGILWGRMRSLNPICARRSAASFSGLATTRSLISPLSLMGEITFIDRKSAARPRCHLQRVLLPKRTSGSRPCAPVAFQPGAQRAAAFADAFEKGVWLIEIAPQALALLRPFAARSDLDQRPVLMDCATLSPAISPQEHGERIAPFHILCHRGVSTTRLFKNQRPASRPSSPTHSSKQFVLSPNCRTWANPL